MGKNSKNKGAGSGQPTQKKTRLGESSTTSTNTSNTTAAKPHGKDGRPTSPATAKDPPPPTPSAEGTADTTTTQQRPNSPIIDVEMTGSRASSPSRTAAPKDSTTTTPPSYAKVAQSPAGPKASSGPTGTKRRLAVPNWSVGKSMYEVPEWESYQRPPPKVPHQFVAFVSLKESSFSAADVIVAGAHFFGKDLVAADVFSASRQVAFAFSTAAQATAAVKRGLPMDEETTLSLDRRSDYIPQIRRLTVSNVDCTSPAAAVKALRTYFKPHGRVLDITPRYWADTHVHNGVWQVSLDVNKNEVNRAPPEVDIILGQDVFIDVPGFVRVCRHCASSVHSRRDCQTWKRLQAKPEALAAYERQIASDMRLSNLDQVRQQRQQQHQKQQQQKQKQQQQRQQQQRTQQEQSTKEDDAESSHLKAKALAEELLRKVDLTTRDLQTIEEDAPFEERLARSLAEYETASTSSPFNLEYLLPDGEALERTWRETREAWLQGLADQRAMERRAHEEATKDTQEEAASRGGATYTAADTSFTMGEAQDLNAPVEDVISGFLNETLASSIHAPGYVPPVDTSASGDPQVVTPTFVRPTSRTPPGVLTYQGEGLVDRGTLTSPPPIPSHPNTRSHSRQ